jgi:hypothetical protein
MWPHFGTGSTVGQSTESIVKRHAQRRVVTEPAATARGRDRFRIVVGGDESNNSDAYFETGHGNFPLYHFAMHSLL